MFRNLFGMQGPKRLMLTPDVEEANGSLFVEPRQLITRHRSRLTAIKLESGYARDEFEKFIPAVVHQVAEYVHLLPATRNENHSEPGGLLRFAIETAALAFRRADGKFLSGPISTDIHNRERDRVWRYATFVAGLCRPIGRAAVSARVVSSNTKEIWDAFNEPLWSWMRRVNATSLDIQWRDRGDARPSDAAGVWIASRVMTSSALSYLQSSGDQVFEIVLSALSGERKEHRFCELIDSAFQAAIDQDLAQRSVQQDGSDPGVHLQHRILEALRALVREKWTLNEPGGRLWHLKSGTYIAWKPAVTDILVRLKALGVIGAPSDPETLAELLVSHGVLVSNPQATRVLKHYYKIAPELRGVPKQGLEVVRLADPELVGLDVTSVDALDSSSVRDTEGSPTAHESPANGQRSLQLALDDSRSEPPEQRSGGQSRETTAATAIASPTGKGASLTAPVSESSVSETPSSGSPAEPTDAPREAVDLSALNRFGAAGKVLKAVAQRGQSDPSFKVAHKHSGGVALAYPEGIEPFCDRPQDFLQDCDAQGLLIASKGSGKRILRTRTTQQLSLPEQFIVLSPRVAKYLLASE